MKEGRREGGREGLWATMANEGTPAGGMGKEKGLFWQDAVKLQILGMVFCSLSSVLSGVLLGISTMWTPAACGKPWF